LERLRAGLTEKGGQFMDALHPQHNMSSAHSGTRRDQERKPPGEQPPAAELQRGGEQAGRRRWCFAPMGRSMPSAPRHSNRSTKPSTT
jgi:hypothetical protein